MMVIISEHDHTDVFKSDGPFIREQSTAIGDLDVIEKAASIATSNNYGRVWVAQLRKPRQVFKDGTLEDEKKLVVTLPHAILENIVENMDEVELKNLPVIFECKPPF